MKLNLTPQVLVAAYASGIFPMADEEGRIYWLSPDPRTIIDLETFKVSRSLRAAYRRGAFELTVNRAFGAVIDACAQRPEGTWISPKINRAYRELHRLGLAHSVEAWQEGELAGGLYGVAVGGAFFGESMFFRVSNASKVALVHLVERMRERGFALLDCQFMTGHLRSFGAREIPAAEYEERLDAAIRLPCTLVDDPRPGLQIEWSEDDAAGGSAADQDDEA